MPDDIKLPGIVGTLAGLPEHVQAVVVEYGKACARAAVEAELARRVPLTDEQRRDVLAAAAYVEGADVDASVLSFADAKRIVGVLREIAIEVALGIPAPKGGDHG